MRVLALMASQGISKPGRREGHVFSHLETQEVALLNRGRRIDGVLAKLDYAASRYGWQDVPQSLSYGELEKDRRGAESPKSPPASGPGYLPLPDAFVAEAGWRLLWLIEKLGPPLLACARQMVLVCEATPLQVPGENYFTLKSRRITALERLLKDWTWTSPSDGAVLSGLPFELALGGKGKQRSLFAWPPRLPGDVVELVKLLQVAHLFVFLMSTGGRISEALSLERGCIFETSDEVSRAQGRTYKLVFNDNGQVRDWPLPAVGTSALRQQQELAEALDALGWLYTLEDADTLSEERTALWVRIGSKGEAMKGEHRDHFQQMVQALGLTEMLQGTPLHSHRFRKSIARLIALAIAAGAPKILMDLFGHQSIEMTLHYVLSDPVIKSEMEEVAKAQVVMLAEKALSDIEHNGGPAAEKLRSVLLAERARHGSQFGEAEMHSLAQTLTFGGKVWRLVRPGVMCTKGPQQSGPCNKRLGHPEPARCRSRCDHRLEDAALRDDVDGLLRESVAHLERSLSEDDDITAELWRGQILENINRFSDLRDRWAAHPLVAPLLTQDTTSPTPP